MAPNSSELSLLNFLPLTYHYSHFLAAILDFTSFFTIAFLRAALFFYSLAVLYLQEERKCHFHAYVAPCSHLELESLLYCKHPPPSATHISNLSKISYCNCEYKPSKFGLISSLFRRLGGLDYFSPISQKTIIKCKCEA